MCALASLPRQPVAVHLSLPPLLAPAAASSPPARVDQQAFYEQCRRILKPTGVLAIWCDCRGRGTAEVQLLTGDGRA